jgi:glutaminyl-peptide cyclotransferase
MQGRMMSVCFVLLLAALYSPVTVVSNSKPFFSATNEDCSILDELQFNGTRAYSDIEWQISLGPRLPGSMASSNFRENLSNMLHDIGFEVQLNEHQHQNYNFTNVQARYTPETNASSSLPRVVLSAHYDSRNLADRDENVSYHSQPIDGANDGGSGTAVLMEIARLIPTLDLPYTIELLWTDAEDQDSNFTLGAKAWAENLTTEEVESIDSFILLDMVGDRDLKLQKISPGNDSLYHQISTIAHKLGYANNSTCQTDFPLGILDYSNTSFVFDDHVHPHQLGIPSIDIMDPVYGNETNFGFGTLWHTMNDTIENVSPESLLAVGRIVEYGLLNDMFIDFSISNETTNESDGNLSQNEQNTTVPDQSSSNVYQMAILISVPTLCFMAIIYNISKSRAR